MTPRYHCNEEMDYLGKNSQGYAFACKMCEAVEYTTDPDAPITPDEKPRKSMREYGSATKMGPKPYKG